MRVCACTIASRPMLPSARVAAESFAAQHPELDVFTLLADDPGPGPHDTWTAGTLLGLDDLGRPDLRSRAFRLEQQELSYALTPALLVHLLDRGYDAVLFHKQESLVVGREDAAIAALADCDVLLTPHLLDPVQGEDAADRERIILLSGVYNLGFLGVADRPQARRLLAWWDARLEEHCRRDVAEGLHFEQRWMDLAPSLFGGVRTLRDPTYNVGHWNVTERAVTAGPDGRDVRVGGRPAVLVRFSGYDPDTPERMTRYVDRVPLAALGDAAAVFGRYREALLAAGWAQARHEPYGFDRSADGSAIPGALRRLHRSLPDTTAAAFGDPFATGPDSFRAWATRPVDDGSPPVSSLMLAVREARPDLVERHPDPLGAGRAAFTDWWRTRRDEHGVGIALDPAPVVTRGPAAVTVVTAGRIAQARVLARSLQRHQPDLPLHVLLVGGGEEALDPAGEPFTVLSRPVPGGAEIDRLTLDGAWTDAVGRAKASALLALVHAGHDRVVYLDADTEALGPLDPLLDAAATDDVVLVPHAVDPPADAADVAPELLLLVAGSFNAGVLAVRSGPVAAAFLDWWGRRTVAGVGVTPAAGVFHDQRWLDLVPGLFDGVAVMRDARFDVGPWNLHQRRDEEWRLMHYSGFDPTVPGVASGHHPTVTFDGVPQAEALYARYAQAVLAEGWAPGSTGPVRFADGVPVPPHAGAIAAAAPWDAFDRTDVLGAGPASLRRWLAAPADDGPDAPANLWLGLHELRPDLQEAFPQPLGEDRAAFAAWCRTDGCREYPVDDAFAPGPAA